MNKGIERRMERSVGIEQAYQKAINVLKGSSVDMRDFLDVYGKDVVQDDIDHVKELYVSFREQNKSLPSGAIRAQKLGQILEAIIYRETELSEWIPGAETILPSRYDDLVNGVDVVIRFQGTDEEQKSMLALAVDTVSTSDSSVVREKLKRIKQEIESGSLALIKYLKVPDEAKTPKVLVGFSGEVVEDLIETWLNGSPREIAQHHTRLKMLLEISMQLETFHKYALHIGKEDVASTIQASLTQINNALKEVGGYKSAIPQFAREDEAFKLIREYLDKFENL